ncbi:GTPase regulator Nrf1 [Dispira parvispora]|uniref:GTPase regulator Nrf1 n=1 Tax=Dispira parvispora TaxID=1520584 RepID=A0A9W8E4Q2_9FUNG|nr:GTPase regulator Nrf1 [Dispira parvispora]
MTFEDHQPRPVTRRGSVSSNCSTRSLKRRGFSRAFQGLFHRAKPPRDRPAPMPQPSQPLLPKNFFANERTFLSWLRTSVITGGLGLAILNFGRNEPVYLITSATFVTISLGLMLYSLVQFWTRANRLTLREPGYYDDRFATTFILLVFAVGIGLNLVLLTDRDPPQ